MTTEVCNNKLLNFGSINRRREIYQGPSKILYDGPEPGTYVFYFKDDFDNPYKDNGKNWLQKGALNNMWSEILMTRLESIGIETHFLRKLNMREQLVRSTEPLPFSIKVHNIAVGDLSERLGVDDGFVLPEPIPEFLITRPNKGSFVIAHQHTICNGLVR
jgi:phosphoribosylaminoimidazole-succinocarboxamide synthase